MEFKRKPITKFISWAIITSQITLPFYAGAEQYAGNGTWFSETAKTVAPHIQQGTLDDYAKEKVKALPETAVNKAINKGANRFFPDINIRGGITLEDGRRYRSSEFDAFIPLQESTSSILFGQLGLRDHDNNSFDGRTFVNAGIGFRQESNGFLYGINSFLDADIKNSHLRGGIGGEVFKDTFSVSGNYYFPLTGWKESGVLKLHDERPAYGFDIRAKGAIPEVPWFGAELTYEQYYGDKVDLLGNKSLSRNPSAIGGTFVWKPIPLLELRAGYRDAGSGGSQTEAGLKINYNFGTPLHEQLDYRNVKATTNSLNRRAFVDRNYDIVMEYREQASRIRISAAPVAGKSGQPVNLLPTVSSRYPIQKVEWSGDAELIAGLQQQGSLNSTLILPQLPLNETASQEFSLYLTVTDSRGTTVTSERIPVTVSHDYSSFRSRLSVINDDVQIKDGIFELTTPIAEGEQGKVIEWHYIRERSDEDWVTLRPQEIKYTSDTQGVNFKSLGGEERDGRWVERVQVTHNGNTTGSLQLNIHATGPDGKQDVKGTVIMNTSVPGLAEKISTVEVLFTPGTDELNGSVTSPVVGSVMNAKTTCIDGNVCTDKFNYQWEISSDNSKWEIVPEATQSTWKMPLELNGKSLQNHYVRVRVISEK
ncbi:inverse autotransporter beta domain-containing protein [Enterobacter hormaechei]|uniref:inverse autotransporter beta domain-containing protein n=1 Tax=Enterobacter hormaechei TaxID=158836 RepID=UPI00296514D6|nr:inverse autotransporter beta domain-containing protein [Enterobacter hormaechei]MDW2601529.1 inverse autotransporter beta domain-containing protein [Enterobacter hormaechei]